jgi:hypothetical protein
MHAAQSSKARSRASPIRKSTPGDPGSMNSLMALAFMIITWVY